MFLILVQQTGFDLAKAFVEAREEAKVKHEVCATLMGISSQQLSQQLAGRRHLSANRLFRLAFDADGLRVLVGLQRRINDYLGLHESGTVAQQLKTFMELFPKLVDRFQVQMAKADLREAELQQRRA